MSDQEFPREVTNALADRANSIEVEDRLDDVLATRPAPRVRSHWTRSRWLVPAAAVIAVFAGVVGAASLMGGSNDPEDLVAAPEVTVVATVPTPVDGHEIEVVEVAILMDREAGDTDHEAIEALLESLSDVAGFEVIEDDSSKADFFAVLDDISSLDPATLGAVYRISISGDADVESIVSSFEAMSGVETVEGGAGDDDPDEVPPVAVRDPICAPAEVWFEESSEAVRSATHLFLDGDEREVTDGSILRRGRLGTGEEGVELIEGSDAGDPCAWWTLRAIDGTDDTAALDRVSAGLRFARHGLTIGELYPDGDDESDDHEALRNEFAVLERRIQPGDPAELVMAGWRFAEFDGATVGVSIDTAGRAVCILHHAEGQTSSTCSATDWLAHEPASSVRIENRERTVILGAVVDQVREVRAGGRSVEPERGLFLIELPEDESDSPTMIEYVMTDGSVVTNMFTATGRTGAEVRLAGMVVAGTHAACASDGLVFRATAERLGDGAYQGWRISPGRIELTGEDEGDHDAVTERRVVDGSVVVTARWTDDEQAHALEIACNDAHVDTRPGSHGSEPDDDRVSDGDASPDDD